MSVYLVSNDMSPGRWTLLGCTKLHHKKSFSFCSSRENKTTTLGKTNINRLFKNQENYKQTKWKPGGVKILQRN